MPTSTQEQLQRAQHLLNAPQSRHEDNIRQDIGRLLDSLQVDNRITHKTPGGDADLYLPRRRIVIETKSDGLATDPHRPQPGYNNETPFQQLERYLLSELEDEKSRLSLDDHPDLRWTGILTDGRIWHVWHYDHVYGAVAQHRLNAFRPRDAAELLRELLPIFNVDPIGKPWIPSNPLPIFQPSHDRLRDIYDNLGGRNLAETETKKQLWREMLRTSSMEPENDAGRHRLFVTHSFLVALARGVIHTLSSPTVAPAPRSILGDGFVSWVLATHRGFQWATSLLEQIHGYEWRRQRGDVLRPLYERFVHEEDRKAFGEYYTPDWLAELLVEHVLDDAWCRRAVRQALAAERSHTELTGVGVLDPACGSGTFLYFAAQRLLRSPLLADHSAARKSAVVARLVNGIDVHPVAAEISRATLLRALPAEPPDGKSSIRVYEGDSLLVNADDETSLFRPKNGEIRITTPKGGEILLPRSFIEQPGFADNLRRLVAAATQDAGLPSDIQDSVPEQDRRALQKCYSAFVDIIQREGNSVWTWYIANTTGPLRLTEQKVDRIVANPPWVSMADIQVESRKRALENFAKRDMNLWTGGRDAPHFDIAQLFLKRARELYLRNPSQDPAAWIVKKSALRGRGWTRFREWHGSTLAQSIDFEAVQPFGGGDARRCCVLFDNRKARELARNDPARIVVLPTGHRPATHTSLQEALRLLTFQPAPRSFPQQPSAFVDHNQNPLFREGATITPKVLTVVQSITSAGADHRTVTTKRSKNDPWCDLDPQTGEVPLAWLRDLLTSNELLPFAIRPSLQTAIIPTRNDGELDTLAAAHNPFWNNVDTIYRELRGQGRHTPSTLLERINYNRALSIQPNQPGKRPTVVLQPASGDIMRAARIPPGFAVLQDAIHYFQARTSDEAAFLVALLNAPCLTRAFAESRTSGRHFKNNPWRAIPIPRYDRANPLHRRLATLCKRAEREFGAWLASAAPTHGQVAASKRIRRMLIETGLFHSIDEAARAVLPNHADDD